jgi:MFS family permease
MIDTQIRQHLRHNFLVNVIEGGFFGFGLGFASAVTVIPLFVNTMTDSTTLIGLIAAIQLIGWQFPQLLTAARVAGLTRYKRMVLWMTLHERWPFLALAVVALLIPAIDNQIALALTFVLFTWHAIGGGITATAWQSMLSKIIPVERRGTFFGTQTGAVNLLSGLGSVIAGGILAAVPYPYNFALCFLLTSGVMAVSFVFLAQTREPESAPRELPASEVGFVNSLRRILRDDGNFRRFVLARAVFQLAFTALSFYTIFGVRIFAMDEATAGLLAGILMFAQVAAAPIIGYIGDQWGHRRVFALGALMMSISTALAMTATSIAWLYPVFVLAGFANAVLFTTGITMTVEFGQEHQRPYYIGLTNTLIAPVTLFGPVLGGWLIDQIGFAPVFGITMVSGLVAAGLLFFTVRDPRPRTPAPLAVPTQS